MTRGRSAAGTTRAASTQHESGTSSARTRSAIDSIGLLHSRRAAPTRSASGRRSSAPQSWYARRCTSRLSSRSTHGNCASREASTRSATAPPSPSGNACSIPPSTVCRAARRWLAGSTEMRPAARFNALSRVDRSGGAANGASAVFGDRWASARRSAASVVHDSACSKGTQCAIGSAKREQTCRRAWQSCKPSLALIACSKGSGSASNRDSVLASRRSRIAARSRRHRTSCCIARADKANIQDFISRQSLLVSVHRVPPSSRNSDRMTSSNRSSKLPGKRRGRPDASSRIATKVSSSRRSMRTGSPPRKRKTPTVCAPPDGGRPRRDSAAMLSAWAGS